MFAFATDQIFRRLYLKRIKTLLLSAMTGIMKASIISISLTFSAAVNALSPDVIEYCKQQAHASLNEDYQLGIILGGDYPGLNNPRQLLQQAYDRCISFMKQAEARQREIDTWQPRQLQQPPQQQTREKKGWFDWW